MSNTNNKIKINKAQIDKDKNSFDMNMDMKFDMDMSSFSMGDLKKEPVKTKAVNETTDLEKDMHEMEKELTAEQVAFRAQLKSEKGAMDTAVDSGFWFCVCFVSFDHKEEFLKKSGLEVYGNKYLDGHKLAKSLGIELTTPLPKRPNMFKNRKNFGTLT